MTDFARALVRSGHRVRLVCARFAGSNREADVDGLRVYRISGERLLGPAALVSYELHFRRNVDLVLTEVIGGARFPFFAPLYVHKPTISVWHQDHLPIFEHQYGHVLLPALAALERILVRLHSQTTFLVPSARSREDLIRKGIDPGLIRIFHPGLPRILLNSEVPPRAQDREPRAVCLGKIRRYKAVHNALLAFSLVARLVPQAQLSIIGRSDDPDYLAELRRVARIQGIEERVEFVINATEKEKLDRLRGSRALLAPAPIEGFGIAIIEANACGLPAVGTEGVPVDSLQEGRNGFRVPFANIGEMAARAAQLLSDDVLFDRMSSESRRFAQQFTLENSVAPLLQIVAEIERERPRRPNRDVAH